MDLRNVVFAIALSFAVLFGWSVIFETPQIEEQKKLEQNQGLEKNDNKNTDAPSVNIEKERVLNIYQKGLEIGKSTKKPIFISESVPGGTTTAQAVMEAFGLNVRNLNPFRYNKNTATSIISPRMVANMLSSGVMKSAAKNNPTLIKYIERLC